MTLSYKAKCSVLTVTNRELEKSLKSAKAQLARNEKTIEKLLQLKQPIIEKLAKERADKRREAVIESKLAKIKEFEEKYENLLSLGHEEREQHIKQMESKLLSLSSEIKEREAKLAEIDSKVRRLRELENTIDMMAENIVKRTAALCHTLDELTSFHSSTLNPNP